MKAPVHIHVVCAALFLAGFTQAEQIDVTFDDVPTNVVCGQTWTNDNVVLNFGETVDGEGVTSGNCYFEADPGFVWLYPCRLVVNFSQLSQPVTGIVANVQYDLAGLFAYKGASQIAQDGNLSGGTFSLNFTNVYPDYCAITADEGIVSGITIYTVWIPPPTLSVEQTNGVVTVLWPTNQSAFILESSSDFKNASGWTVQTNIQTSGTNFYYTIASPTGSEFFRLRHQQ